MWFGLFALWPLKKCQKSFLDQFESAHYSLNRFNKVSDFIWIDLYLLESIHAWIVSFLSKSSHKCLWQTLNRFAYIYIYIYMYIWIDSLLSVFTWNDSIPLWIDSFSCTAGFVFLMSESIQPFSELIHSVLLVWKLYLFTPHCIFYPSHNSKIIESFASILSRSQKLIVQTFFKIKHFFLESLCSLSA